MAGAHLYVGVDLHPSHLARRNERSLHRVVRADGRIQLGPLAQRGG